MGAAAQAQTAGVTRPGTMQTHPGHRCTGHSCSVAPEQQATQPYEMFC